MMLQHDVLAVACCSRAHAGKPSGPWRETFRFPHFEKVFWSLERDFFHFIHSATSHPLNFAKWMDISPSFTQQTPFC